MSNKATILIGQEVSKVCPLTLKRKHQPTLTAVKRLTAASEGLYPKFMVTICLQMSTIT